MSAAAGYSSYVRPSRATTRPQRVNVGGYLTPLHEVVAPAVWRLPGDVRAPLLREFYGRHDQAEGWTEKGAAQGWLAAEVAAMRRSRIDVAFDEWAIDERAKKGAELCGKFLTLEPAAAYASALGVIPPEPGNPKNITRLGALKRLQCPKWWRRQLRRQWTRSAETHMRGLGIVQKKKQLYATDRAVAWRRTRRARDKALLQELQVVSDAGDQLELWDVVQASPANPAIRRAGLMVRVRGFEEVAQSLGHVGEFFTLTAPSAYHCTNQDGERNPHWQGFSPRDAQAWLCRMWARARAKLDSMNVLLYGFRVAEPHHDGTPHWHLLIFTPQASAETVRFVLRSLWLSEYGGEVGASEHRCKVKRIDPAKGSASGYIAKYVAKNIDGFQVGQDDEAEGVTDATQTAERVQAWASAYNARQFQQIGGPPVGLWNELRRIRRSVENEKIEAVRLQCEAQSWAGFIAENGGIAAGRNTHVRLWKERTGELSSYGEVRPDLPAGVMLGADPRAAGKARLVRTRPRVWRIVRKQDAAAGRGGLRAVPEGLLLSPLGPVSITVVKLKSVPTAKVTGAHRSRGSPGETWMH